MRLALVDNLVLPEEGSLGAFDVHPHLGLLALANAAAADGHQVRIYDPKWQIHCGKLQQNSQIYSHVATELLQDGVDAVGFTSLGCSFLFALNVAAELRRMAPGLPILVGGPHATMLHTKILQRFNQFDVVVRHEADQLFPAVLRKLESRDFTDIEGITWRASDRSQVIRSTPGSPKVENLDLLPICSYEYYPIHELPLLLLRVEAGRGCPFSCTFCSTAGFFQRSFRMKSADRIVAELDILNSRYGFNEFKLDHDMFTVNRRKVLEFCEAVANRGYRWRASARVDCVDKALLEQMALAGCAELYFGIEAGSERLQRAVKKKLDLALVIPTLEAAAFLGMETTASFITGYPQEERTDQEATLDLLGKCAENTSCLPQLHVLVPEPGTPLLDQFKDRMRYDGSFGPYNFRPLMTEDEKILMENPDLFSTYFYYEGELGRSDHLFAAAAVAQLRKVGPVIMRCFLRALDESLSAFVNVFRAYCDSAMPSDEAMIGWLRMRFGSTHYLVSLFRLALANNSPRPAQPTMQGRPDTSYRMSSNLVILEDMHDCEELLAQLSAGNHEPHVGPRDCTYLVGGANAAAPYRVDSGLADVLRLFAFARTIPDVAQELARLTGDVIEPERFSALVAHGFLTPAA